MKTFPQPLPAKEEQYYLQRLGEGDARARDILVEHNLRLVAHIVKKYQSPEEEMEDLISIGTIGLIKAIATYKEDYGSRLATYAARCIDNELLMYFRAKKKTSKEVSLYEPIGTDKEGNQIQIVDVVEGEEVDVVENLEQRQQIAKVLHLVPKVLSSREQFIIVKRYGLFGSNPMTQREISENLAISRSYVSRIEKRALEKLRKNL